MSPGNDSRYVSAGKDSIRGAGFSLQRTLARICEVSNLHVSWWRAHSRWPERPPQAKSLAFCVVRRIDHSCGFIWVRTWWRRSPDLRQASKPGMPDLEVRRRRGRLPYRISHLQTLRKSLWHWAESLPHLRPSRVMRTEG